DRITNGVIGTPAPLMAAGALMGVGGSITYRTLEILEIELGNAADSNVFTIESTHGDGSITAISSGTGADVFNIETMAGNLTLSTGGGSDTVRVGTTTGDIGQQAGVLDAFDSSANAIVGRLEIDAGTGNADTLKLYDSGDTTRENGRLSSAEIVGMGMTLGIGYTGFDVLKIWLSNNDNGYYIDSTHAGVTFVDLGDEQPVVNGVNDVVNVRSISGPTTIDAGQGNDVIRVNFDDKGEQTFVSGIDGELTLHGQQGSDRYEIGLAGQISSRINVFDQSGGDPGINRLRIYGTNDIDFFLLRANKDVGIGMVSAVEVDANRAPVPGGVIERINYDADISGAVEIFGRAGDDTFVLDDNLAPTTIFGDAGIDTFQIGQVYQSFRDGRNPDNGLAEEDYFETTQITRGFLSNGVSQSTVLFGGTGNDNFTVYSNKAELFLFGDEDDDTFTVRAFVKVDPNDPKAPFTNINGGQGADFIAFTVNAPVRIDGGDGFDTLTVIGTEFGDDFVVNDQGVYGAGLFVTYTGLERIVVDAIEGNDRFFIESTSESVSLEIVGGLGSDTFHVGGSNGNSVTVVSNKLEGHSGLVIQTTTTDDPGYKNVFVKDVSVDVRDNDEAEVVVLFDIGPIRVFENGLGGALTVNSYRVVLSRAPEENVTVKAVAVALRESVLKAGGKGLALNSTNSLTGASEDGIELTFNRNNWFAPQTVYVFAPQDALAEGTNGFNIVHRTQQGSSAKDGGDYDGLAVLGVVATVVDDDSASVLIASYDNSAPAPHFFEPIVAEGGAVVGGGVDPVAPGGLQQDSYWVVLTKAPTGNVQVNFAFDAQIEFVSATGPGVVGSTITFSTTDWSTPRKITVKAANDTALEGTHYSRITHTVPVSTVSIPKNLDNFLGVTSSNIADGLAAKINGNLDTPFVATANGDKVTLTGPAFRYNLATPYASPTVALGGVAVAGEVWALVVNGKTWFHLVDAGQTVTQIADSLRSKIDADSVFAASGAGNELTITASGGGLVTVGFLV
ncbi:MAG: hypothetical protein JNK59_07945, partial [Sterolibacteriaceae bacterium]|nr:hypothetical protein [Sterolibacteriaceae bacterium]